MNGALMLTSLITTLAGSATSAYGQYLQGEIEAKRLEYNARFAEETAKSKIKQGKIAARKHRQRVSQFIGQQKAGYGASGVNVNTGAPADIISETALHGEDDAYTIRRNAALEAWGYRTKAGDYRIGAAGSRFEGRLGAGTTLLTGLGSTALRFAEYKED